ncbi:hypothetical protein [Marinitoga lauensis]|uniref:hypothetical protein n=1 Tax=Marinitoga lauensis TaxID=2201189 RepID=UPI00101072DA|nr:hypothetical protein [Marinitoga lauensis]
MKKLDRLEEDKESLEEKLFNLNNEISFNNHKLDELYKKKDKYRILLNEKKIFQRNIGILISRKRSWKKKIKN